MFYVTSSQGEHTIIGIMSWPDCCIVSRGAGGQAFFIATHPSLLVTPPIVRKINHWEQRVRRSISSPSSSSSLSSSSSSSKFQLKSTCSAMKLSLTSIVCVQSEDIFHADKVNGSFDLNGKLFEYESTCFSFSLLSVLNDLLFFNRLNKYTGAYLFRRFKVNNEGKAWREREEE